MKGRRVNQTTMEVKSRALWETIQQSRQHHITKTTGNKDKRRGGKFSHYSLRSFFNILLAEAKHYIQDDIKYQKHLMKSINHVVHSHNSRYGSSQLFTPIREFFLPYDWCFSAPITIRPPEPTATITIRPRISRLITNNYPAVKITTMFYILIIFGCLTM